MKTLKEQTEAKVAMGRKANPNFMQGVDDIIEEAKAFQKGKGALKITDKSPNFTLPNQTKTLVSLNELLEKGPVVVTFYRGNWCPYCSLQLNALQEKIGEIHTLGAELVAISPQIPDNAIDKKEIDNIDFIVLSDQNAKIASQYGVSWEVPEFLLEHMKKDRNLDLESINNGNANIIPIPATFVISSKGIIVWRYLDVDYRTRAEPDDIIEILKSVN